MANRYTAKSIVETWNAYEWLLRSKLEELDHMTRQMYRDMAMTGTNAELIREFIPQQFERIWHEVAEEQERQNGRKIAQ